MRARLAQAAAAAARLAERELAADERVEVGAAHDDVAAVVEVAVELVEDGGVDERQRAARPAGGERPGSGGVAVALAGPRPGSASASSTSDDRRLGGRREDQRLDEADARVGRRARRPRREVQRARRWILRGSRRWCPPGPRSRPTARRTSRRRAGRCRRAPGAGRSTARPAEGRRVGHRHEPEAALGKPRALLVAVERDVARRRAGDVRDAGGKRGSLGVVRAGGRRHVARPVRGRRDLRIPRGAAKPR